MIHAKALTSLAARGARDCAESSLSRSCSAQAAAGQLIKAASGDQEPLFLILHVVTTLAGECILRKEPRNSLSIEFRSYSAKMQGFCSK
jgi:hypothetical protein